MARVPRKSSKRSDEHPKRRKNAAEYRASHRQHSAASADRKRATGLVRLSVWVPLERSDNLKLYAKGLCAGKVPDDIGRAHPGHRQIVGSGSIEPQLRKKRKEVRCDARQLDLFSPE